MLAERKVECDVPLDRDGRALKVERDALHEAVDEYNAKCPVVGRFRGLPSSGATLKDTVRVSHVTRGVELRDDGSMVADVAVLDTPWGRHAKALLESGGATCCVSVGGRVDEDDGVQVSVEISSVDFYERGR